MVKLTKTKSSSWAGNGFGCTSAEWVVKGHEHIVVEKLLSQWWARDYSQMYINQHGFEVPAFVAKGSTKKDLVEALSEIL
jgi:hypothetical protein